MGVGLASQYSSQFTCPGVCLQREGVLHPGGSASSSCGRGLHPVGVCIQQGVGQTPPGSVYRGVGGGGGQTPDRDTRCHGLRSTVRRYASYWNAFLLGNLTAFIIIIYTDVTVVIKETLVSLQKLYALAL